MQNLFRSLDIRVPHVYSKAKFNANSNLAIQMTELTGHMLNIFLSLHLNLLMLIALYVCAAG